jgi:hypothetical protein
MFNNIGKIVLFKEISNINYNDFMKYMKEYIIESETFNINPISFFSLEKMYNNYTYNPNPKYIPPEYLNKYDTSHDIYLLNEEYFNKMKNNTSPLITTTFNYIIKNYSAGKSSIRTPYEKRTLTQLRSLAKSRKIANYAKLTKPELITKLRREI